MPGQVLFRPLFKSMSTLFRAPLGACTESSQEVCCEQTITG